ncbi:BCCT family transporter [Pyramidobacter sp. YE332]|uniref:BCCT family transporter n=1 Tax=Pyramidobacter sp. YE332 TaxID=3068894 RepID=UPI00294B0B21|nr:BCCT family transporter [Pyramidobacter sp. YE332]WOL39461.1 BCCT family transporter [Pyramidobacter sp. YE332]
MSDKVSRNPLDHGRLDWSGCVDTKSNTVYYVSILITFAAVLWGLLSPDSFGSFAKSLFNGLTTYFGAGYMFFMNVFVIFCLFIAAGRFGKVRLGRAEDRPEYGNLAWFAMLFSAGMGVGLVFYGAAEPLIYFTNPPFGAAPESVQAARDALQISFFHWGLHPWAGYAVIAMPLAYYQFRYNAPGLISSIFIPLVGEKAVKGTFGKVVDILATFATLGGITTSLGLGTLQLNSGANTVFGLPKTTFVQVVIIAILAVLYTGSAVLGIKKGISKVADFNIRVCFILMALMFIVGPSLPIVESFMTGIGDFLSGLVEESFMMDPYGAGYQKHLANWTLYYWAWWIAWAPFVGAFVARISRGRTISEFIAGVLIVPALGSAVWFAIFGTSALHLELVQHVKIAAEVIKDVSVGAFELYKHYPLGTAMSYGMIVLITTFFVTSANSATFVLAAYCQHGTSDPSKSKMAIWGILMGALAVVLLTTGGLINIQTISLCTAPPFAFIMFFSCWGFWKALNADERNGRL